MVDTTVTVIAEAGVNHNGDITTAKELIRASVTAGAQVFKIQTFSPSDVVSDWAATASYQKSATGYERQRDMIKHLAFTEEQHRELVACCEELSIEFMSSPFDEASVEMLDRIGVKRYKIASGEITHRRLIASIAEKNKPIILSTGMATIPEIDRAIEWIHHYGVSNNPDITLLHCTSNYPTDPADVHMACLTTLNNEYNLPVGYSDHTTGFEACLMAVSMGATILEKHLTLDRNQVGPDHASSADPGQLSHLIASVNRITKMRGTGFKAPRQSELEIRDLVRRSAFATKALGIGHIVGESDIAYLRPLVKDGVPSEYNIVGATVLREISIGAPILMEDILI